MSTSPTGPAPAQPTEAPLDPTVGGPPAGAGADPTEDQVDLNDLRDDPRTDVEALCLCALLWATPATVALITSHLHSTDFAKPTYAALFDVIADHRRQGTPHDPASIASTLTSRGHSHHIRQQLSALTDVTGAGTAPDTAGHYAAAVARAAYRRSFHRAAAHLTHAAHELPDHDLFEHLLSVGREQRTATDRFRTIERALGRSEHQGD